MTSELLVAAGHWAGTNGFRMMPVDEFSEHPATAIVAVAAGGTMTSFAYTWTHPDDGLQDGLLVFGALATDDESLVGLWGDSWHQQPTPMSMPGRRTAPGEIEFTGDYGAGWLWRIVVDASAAGALTMRMDNVVPPEDATEDTPRGPYAAMTMTLLPGVVQSRTPSEGTARR